MYALEAYAGRHGGSSPFILTYLPKGENNGCTHAVIALSTYGVDFIGVVAKLANAPALHAGD